MHHCAASVPSLEQKLSPNFPDLFRSMSPVTLTDSKKFPRKFESTTKVSLSSYEKNKFCSYQGKLSTLICNVIYNFYPLDYCWPRRSLSVDYFVSIFDCVRYL